jgi:hypothetical protein
MLGLTPRDLRARILGCGGGPANFNAEATAAGHRVVSCDPLYRLAADDVRRRVEEGSGALLQDACAHRDRIVRDGVRSSERLGEARMAVIDRFLVGISSGLAKGRYKTDALPYLTFEDDSFRLALCSHL